MSRRSGANYHQPVAAQTGRWQSLHTRLLRLVVRPTAPPLWVGVLVAVGLIVAEALLVLQLKRVAPENAFGAVFLLGVLVVSAAWGLGLAVATSVVSAAVYMYFHLEGTDSVAPALFVFLPLALLANLLAGQARLRAAEAEQRRVEADLSAELARSTLRASDLRDALDRAGRRVAEVLGLPAAHLDLDTLAGGDDQIAIALEDDGEPVGTLLVPAGLPKAAQQRVLRMIPALEGLLAATRDRWAINEALAASHAEVSALAAQQAALRRVATLVARGADPAEVYPAAVAELAAGLQVQHVTLVRYEADDDCVVLATQDSRHTAKLTAGERFSLDGDSLSSQIRRTAEPDRIDDYVADGRPDRRADACPGPAFRSRRSRHRRRAGPRRAARRLEPAAADAGANARRGSAISPTWWPPRSTTPRTGRSSGRPGRASSPPPIRPAVGSNATSTTAPSSGSWPSEWTCARWRPRCPPTGPTSVTSSAGRSPG